jgi:hypothetical protein
MRIAASGFSVLALIWLEPGPVGYESPFQIANATNNAW